MKNLITLLIILQGIFISNKSVSQTVTTPFRLVRNLMVVKAAVNGKEGLFILDTGVPDVTLNNRLFTGISGGEKFYGINGVESEKEISFVTLEMAGLTKKLMVILSNFAALEQAMGISLSGVIGNNFFSTCEVVFDYVFEEVTIYELDKKGNRLASKDIHQIPQETFSFFQGTRMPYLEVTLHGRVLRMGLDTGASVNIVDQDIADRMPHLFSDFLSDSLVSFGGNKTQTFALTLNNLMTGTRTCPPMKTLMVNLDHLNRNRLGVKLDGLLGYPFLRHFRVAINYRKWEIYLWDREIVETQLLASVRNGN